MLFFRYLLATLKHSKHFIEAVANAPKLTRKCSDPLESDDKYSVRVPFMITNIMREQLRNLGFTEGDIYSMRSDKAHEILQQHRQSHVLPAEDL